MMGIKLGNLPSNLYQATVWVCCSILAACSAQPVATATPTKTIITPTVSPTPSATQVPVTPTASPEPYTPTPTLPPSVPGVFQYRKECILIDTKFSPEVKFHGGLLLGGALHPPTLMDLSTQQEINLPEPEDNEFSLSPDGQWMAYTRNGKQLTLVIKSFSQQKTLEVPLGTNKHQGNGIWVNNEQILLFSDYTQPLAPKYLFNPFTKSKVSINLRGTYPGVYPDEVFEDASGTTLAHAALDPSMNYAVYPAMKGDTFGLKLFNRKLNRQIAFIPNSLPPVVVYTPQWNSSGTQFVFNSSPLEDKDQSKQYTDELHLGGINGSVQQLTRFSEQISGYDLGLLAWSPNDRYIAFVIYGQLSAPNRLMFLDMQKKEVLDVCIAPKEGGFQGFVWSPDGNQMVINIGGYDSFNKMMLIDMSMMRGVTFSSQSGFAESWVALEP